MELYHNTIWKYEYEHLNALSYISNNKLKFDCLENGIVLPGKTMPDGHEYGGLIDNNGVCINETTIPGYFGGSYDFNKQNIKKMNETIFLLPVVYHQWGHFLVDTVSWLWPMKQYKAQGYTKFGYTGAYFNDGLEGNYLEFLNLLGIDKEDLIKIEEPTQFECVFYSERAFGNWTDSHTEYKEIIDRVKYAALEKAKKLNLPKYNKLYLTRDVFVGSMEIGEKILEKTFEINNFKIIAPEKLSLVEQIWYIYNADTIASLSGSVSLNAMFAANNSKWTILNRTCQPNLIQHKINEMFHVNYDFVDCYSIRSAQKQLSNTDVPVFVKDTKEFNAFLKTAGYKKHRKTLLLKLGYYALYQKRMLEKSLRKTTSVNALFHKKPIKKHPKTIELGSYVYEKISRKPIEWYLLDTVDNQCLLLSKYGIDRICFNEKCEATSWENSSIREWLNTSFYHSAFSEAEKERIVITNHSEKELNTPEESVKDSVFLLSDEEAERYLTSGKLRKCKSVGAKQTTVSWWLRTSGHRQYNAKNVDTKGNINHHGVNAHLRYCMAVRPAMWVNADTIRGCEQLYE